MFVDTYDEYCVQSIYIYIYMLTLKFLIFLFSYIIAQAATFVRLIESLSLKYVKQHIFFN